MKARALFTAFLLTAALLPLHALSSDLLDIAQSATAAQVQQAVRNGADPNAMDSMGRTVLMLVAAFNPDPAVISALAKAGAKVNTRGPQGWTALIMAAYSNPNPQVVLALLAAGADPRLRSAGGRTAFDYGQDNDKLKGTDVLRKLKTSGR